MKSASTPDERLSRLQEIARSAGGELLSETYLGTKVHYEWKCNKGHIWKATPDRQGKSRWCPRCGIEARSAKKSLTTKEINRRLSLRGLKLVGEYDSKLSLQNCTCLVCKKLTKASFKRIPKGYGCRTCLRKIQSTYRQNKTSDIRKELAKYNISLLGTYEGVSKRMDLKCDLCRTEFAKSLDSLRERKRHLCENTDKSKIVQAEQYLADHKHKMLLIPKTLSSLLSIQCLICGSKKKISYSEFKKQKTKCITCEQNVKYEKIKKKAQNHGGEILTPKYLGVGAKYRFKCKNSHIWLATPQGKSWCPTCAGKGKSIKDIRNLVKKRGGKLLSDEFIGVDKKYDLTCSVGHKFSMTFSKMLAGQWCSICSKGSKSEELVRVMMEQIFGVDFKRVRPSWLKNDLNVPMELDGYSSELNIAFEYQGRQHYEETKYLFGQDLKRIQKNDKLKSQICKKSGVSLFIFTHKDDYRNFSELAHKQARKLGIPIDNYNFSQEIDFDRAYIRADKLEELKRRTEMKGLKLLSKKWLGVKHYYEVECQVCFNAYEVSGVAFMGDKINGCRFCALGKNNNKSTLKIDIPSDYAKKHKGKLLDSEYKNMHADMRWRCKKGHEFIARFNNMVRRDQFCPVCEGRNLKNQFNHESAVQKFLEFDLVLLDAFMGVGIAVQTRCKKCKNINSSRLNAIIKGSPACLFCSGKRIDQKTAFYVLRKNGLKPLGEYVNSYKPISCRCQSCGLVKSYKVSTVKATSRGCNHKS